MPLPTDYGTGVVTGTFTDTNGDPVVGTISFTPSASRLLGTGAVILGDAVVVKLDAEGSLSVTLPASNDPNVNPTDFTYRVDETFVGTVGSTYFIDVLEGTTLDLSDVAVPGVVNNGTVIWAGQLPSQTGNAGKLLRTNGTTTSWAGLGSVIAAATEKDTPVGADEFVLSDSAASGVEKRVSFTDLAAAIGGGAVDSVNGQTGTVVLDATDVGADVAGAAAAVTTSSIGAVPTARTVNGHALSADVTVSASDITTGTLPIAQVPTGTTSSTVPFGNDSRFTDSRTPNVAGSNDDIMQRKAGVWTYRTPAQVAGDLTTLAPLASPTFTGTVTVPDATIANAKLANMTAKTVKMRHTNSTGAPEDTSMANLLTDLSGQAGAAFDMNGQRLTNGADGTSLTDFAVVSQGRAWSPKQWIMPAARWSGSGAVVGSPLAAQIGSPTTSAMAAGQHRLWPMNFAGQTLTKVTIRINTTSLTGSQYLEFACYNMASDGGPGTRRFVQNLVVGTTTGVISTSSLSLSLPDGGCWLSLLNPSGNAGSVSIYVCAPVQGAAVCMSTGNMNAVSELNSITTSASDLTSYTFADSASSSVIGASSTSVPWILANT